MDEPAGSPVSIPRRQWRWGLSAGVGLMLTVAGIAWLATGRRGLVASVLVVQPGSLVWGLLPERVIDRLPDTSLFPLGFLTAWFFWTLVAALVMRVALARRPTSVPPGLKVT